MSVTKPASYLRPSCSWISRFAMGSSMGASIWVAIAGCLWSDGGEAGGDALLRSGSGPGMGWWLEHLREADPAQRIGDDVVDAPPVGARPALAGDAAAGV